MKKQNEELRKVIAWLEDCPLGQNAFISSMQGNTVHIKVELNTQEDTSDKVINQIGDTNAK